MPNESETGPVEPAVRAEREPGGQSPPSGAVVRDSSRAAIVGVLHAYAATLDAQQWDALEACFAADVRATYRGAELAAGRNALMSYLRDSFSPPEIFSRHYITTSHVTLSGPFAHAISHAISCRVTSGAAGSTLMRQRGVLYRDELRQQCSGSWLITSRFVTVEWEIDQIPARIPNPLAQPTGDVETRNIG